MDAGTPIIDWQQAFEGYRIPQTRQIEKQIRSTASQNKEKLRTLVGGSYRELLATAQAIVVLDEQTRVAEDRISSIGHNCRPPQLHASLKAPSTDKVVLAQFRLLQRCCITIASCVRDQNLLRGSRLLVISRLLLKSVSDLNITAKSLDALRSKLAGLRRQLLLRIESRLNSPTSSSSNLLKSICSYCLVTSSSGEDAVAHLRQLRLEKTRRMLTASQQRTNLCEALRYQQSSLQTFKSLVGRPMVEAMNDLQSKPILADASIRNLDSLDLDRILPLIPNDIRSFVPYFKRSASSPDEMQSKFEAWSREAGSLFSDALRRCLSEMSQVDEVLDLRKQLYTILLPSYFSTPAGSYLRDEIAQAIDQRVNVIFQARDTLLDQSTNLLLDMAIRTQVQPMWDEDLALLRLDSGGKKLTRQISKRHASHTATSSKALKMMKRWVAAANKTLDQLDEVTKTRWRDVLEEPDEENEEDAVDLIKTLGEKDPKRYREALQSSLQTAVLKHEKGIVEAAGQVEGGPGDLSLSVALLRSIRISVSTLQHAFPEHAKFERFKTVVPQLQQKVANGMVEQLENAVRGRPKASKWDEGLLPENMPSPRAFSTLRQLCRLMVDVGGTDLWSPPLVGKVKMAVSSRVFDPDQRALYMDHDFDEAYLSVILGRKSGGTDPDVVKAKEVLKSASEYWTRTKLLFGVLA